MNLNENCVSVFDDFLRCDKILNLGDTLLAPEV